MKHRTLASLALAGCASTPSKPPVAPEKPGIATGSCIPERAVLSMHFVGPDLVACSEEACWNVDRATGSVGVRIYARLPGESLRVDADERTQNSCYRDLCWTPPRKDEYADKNLYVARSPDGVMTAVVDDPQIDVFDVKSRRKIATFDFELGNTLANVWFARDHILLQGNDAGPASHVVAYSLAGAKVDDFSGFWQGGVGFMRDGRAIIQEHSLSKVTILGEERALERDIPPGPEGCTIADHEPFDTMSDSCRAYLARFYEPYADAMLVDDPLASGSFIGIVHHDVFALDALLREVPKSRVTLTACPKASASR